MKMKIKNQIKINKIRVNRERVFNKVNLIINEPCE